MLNDAPVAPYEYLALVAAGKLSVRLGPVFGFDDLQAAHANMDANRAHGKMVIVLPGRA